MGMENYLACHGMGIVEGCIVGSSPGRKEKAITGPQSQDDKLRC